MKTAVLTLALALPLAVRAADVPTSYTVSDTELKSAVAGTNLTFTLYTDAACTQQAHQQVVPIETVNFVSRLRMFTPYGAPRGPAIDEVHETLTGVNAAGNLYLTVTGTGITPVGAVCQAQATVQPPAPVVKDANGAILGTSGGFSPFGLAYIAFRKVGSDVVGIQHSRFGFERGLCVYFQGDGCTGASFMDPQVDFPYPFGVVLGTTVYYQASGSAGTPVTVFSLSCGTVRGCEPLGPTTVVRVPARTATVPVFTPPFHVEVP